MIMPRSKCIMTSGSRGLRVKLQLRAACAAEDICRSGGIVRRVFKKRQDCLENIEIVYREKSIQALPRRGDMGHFINL